MAVDTFLTVVEDQKYKALIFFVNRAGNSIFNTTIKFCEFSIFYSIIVLVFVCIALNITGDERKIHR